MTTTFYYVHDTPMFKTSKATDPFSMSSNCPCGKFEHEFILVIVHSDTMNDNDRSTYLSWSHHEVR